MGSLTFTKNNEFSSAKGLQPYARFTVMGDMKQKIHRFVKGRGTVFPR